MVRGWLPAGAAHSARAQAQRSSPNKCSPRLPAGAPSAMPSKVRHGVTENSWSTTHFLDELQNVNATVAQNANTNEAALMM